MPVVEVRLRAPVNCGEQGRGRQLRFRGVVRCRVSCTLLCMDRACDAGAREDDGVIRAGLRRDRRRKRETERAGWIGCCRSLWWSRCHSKHHVRPPSSSKTPKYRVRQNKGRLSARSPEGQWGLVAQSGKGLAALDATATSHWSPGVPGRGGPVMPSWWGARRAGIRFPVFPCSISSLSCCLQLLRT